MFDRRNLPRLVSGYLMSLRFRKWRERCCQRCRDLRWGPCSVEMDSFSPPKDWVQLQPCLVSLFGLAKSKGLSVFGEIQVMFGREERHVRISSNARRYISYIYLSSTNGGTPTL